MSKRILIVGPSPYAQGGISSLMGMYKNLSVLSNANFLYTYCEGSKLKKLLFFLKAFFSYVPYLLLNKFDILHIHSASRGSFYRKSIFIQLASLFGKKIIFHLHGGEFDIFYLKESQGYKKKYIYNTIKKADLCLVVSNPWKQIFSSLFPNFRIEVLHNPISDIYLNTSINVAQNKDIVFIGRLEEKKGIFDMLEIFSRLKKDFNDTNLYLIGSGDIESLKKITEELNIKNNVFFMGWLDEKEKIEILKKAAVYCLPSYIETFGISLLEASALGIPVICYDVGGVSDIVSHNNGSLIRVGDTAEFYTETYKLIEDGTLRSRLGNLGKRYAQESFSFNHINEQLHQHYKKLNQPN